MLSALLSLSDGNPLVTSIFPTQRASDGDFDISFVVSLNQLLNKQSWCWWFETSWHWSEVVTYICQYSMQKYYLYNLQILLRHHSISKWPLSRPRYEYCIYPENASTCILLETAFSWAHIIRKPSQYWITEIRKIQEALKTIWISYIILYSDNATKPNKLLCTLDYFNFLIMITSHDFNVQGAAISHEISSTTLNNCILSVKHYATSFMIIESLKKTFHNF